VDTPRPSPRTNRTRRVPQQARARAHRACRALPGVATVGERRRRAVRKAGG
jgi:hypothetical protein